MADSASKTVLGGARPEGCYNARESEELGPGSFSVGSVELARKFQVDADTSCTNSEH